MIKSGFLLSLFIFIGTVYADAQINYGTTGLMNMPTADMQRDKTFMVGGNWLNHHATVPRWWYDTWNYYINITIFPWLEAGYLCTGHRNGFLYDHNLFSDKKTTAKPIYTTMH